MVGSSLDSRQCDEKNGRGVLKKIGICWKEVGSLESATISTVCRRGVTRILNIVVAVIVILSSSAVQALDITPFNTKNQSPLVQIYGIPEVSNTILLPRGGKEFNVTVNHASNYVDEATARERILLDGETTRLIIGGRYGLSERVQVGVQIPYLNHSGGFLDGFIIDYHSLFGFPQGGRDQAPRNRLLYRYSRDGVEKLKIDSTGHGLGDISLSAAFQLYHAGEEYARAVALRTNIKLPTGNSTSLYGSGSTDFSVSIGASDDYRLPLGHATLFGEAGLMVMTTGSVLPEQQRNHVGFGSIGVGWNPLSWIAFKVQVDAHSPLYGDTDLRPLSATAAQFIIGGTLALTKSTTLDIAVSEDVVTTTSPDVVFHFSMNTRF